MSEAERTFSDLINRVHYRGEAVVLTKNGRIVARIIPTDTPVVSEGEWNRRWSPAAQPSPDHAEAFSNDPKKKGLRVIQQVPVPWD